MLARDAVVRAPLSTCRRPELARFASILGRITESTPLLVRADFNPLSAKELELDLEPNCL
jgi:hypothetical protein